MNVALYVHIPFCQRKCGYCDFNSYAGVDPAQQERYVDLLLREMEAWSRRPELRGAAVPTVYVGGGTPTVLSGRLLARILRGVREHFAVAPDAEVTVEANPGTLDVAGEKLHLVREAGANRISFGVQARQEHLLRRLGRIHTAAEAESAVAAARAAGFGNVSLDLMYGLPGQAPGDFEETLRWAISLGPEHISAYSLIIEEGTPFYAQYEAGRLALPPEEDEERMAEEGAGLLEAAGYRQYEVSNFARPGRECRHNLVYWRNEPFLGLGAGAHSYLRLAAPLPNLGAPEPALSASRVQGGAAVAAEAGRPGDLYRFWNLKHPGLYRAALERGDLPVEAGEVIGREEEMAETMIMGLRLLDGVSEAAFARRFGRTLEEVYGPVLARLAGLGLLVQEEGRVRLTRRGLRVGNRVWQEFLI